MIICQDINQKLGAAACGGPKKGALGECAATFALGRNGFRSKKPMYEAYVYLWQADFNDSTLLASWFKECGAEDVFIAHTMHCDSNGDQLGKCPDGDARQWIVTYTMKADEPVADIDPNTSDVVTRRGYEWWDRFCKLARSSFVIGALGGVKRVDDRYGNWLEHQPASELVDLMQTEINMLTVNVTSLHGGLNAAVELMEQEDFATLTLVPRLKQVLLHQNGDRTPCTGRNCASIVPRLHSAECFEDYERATTAVNFATMDLSGPLRAVRAWLDDDMEMETEERWEVCNRIDALLGEHGQ